MNRLPAINSRCRRVALLRVIREARFSRHRSAPPNIPPKRRRARLPKHDSPEERLMRALKAGFVAQGTSYTAWCKAHGIAASGVRQVIYGTWAGPKGKALRHKVLRAAGVKEAA